MSATAAGRMPAVMAGWSADRAAIAAECATWLGGLGAELVACLDQAHEAGVFVPPRAGESVAALQALARAWARNSRGEPADPDDKATLGIGGGS